MVKQAKKTTNAIKKSDQIFFLRNFLKEYGYGIFILHTNGVRY